MTDKIKNEQASNSLFVDMLSEKYKWIFLYTIKNFGNSLKPFDIFGCRNWKMIALEGKFHYWKKEPTSEQIFKKLEPHQVLSLYKVMQAWWYPCVVCYYNWNFIKYELQENLSLAVVENYWREL